MSSSDTGTRSGRASQGDVAGPATGGAGAGSETATPAAGGLRRRLVLVGLVVLVVAATVAVGVFGWRAKRAHDAEESVEMALATARASTVEVLSYDSATLDADLARARPLVTGDFAAQFEQTAGDAIVPASHERSFTTTAEVTRAALVQVQPDRVDVLLAVDQTTRSSTQPLPERRTLQLAVSMTRDAGGQWLISDVFPL